MPNMSTCTRQQHCISEDDLLSESAFIDGSDWKRLNFLRPARKTLRKRLLLLSRRRRKKLELLAFHSEESALHHKNFQGNQTSSKDISDIPKAAGYLNIQSDDCDKQQSTEFAQHIVKSEPLNGPKFPIGILVEVAGRFWANMNKPGGVGRIVNFQYDSDGITSGIMYLN